MTNDPAAAALDSLVQARFIERLWDKDASLWTQEPAHQKIIRGSLGWLSAPEAMAVGLGPVKSFAAEIQKEDFASVVVLGMGGSSLACEVFRDCLAPRAGWPRLETLDSTNPGAVADLESRLDLKRTLFIVASKSGSTIEPNCFLAHFWGLVERLKKKAGRQFVAITDPGTSLEKLARRKEFRKVFLNPSDIGGRYSALSLFGLVPAALTGAPVEALLDQARAQARALRDGGPENQALRLGAALGGHARSGRDKLTLSLSSDLESFGSWIEQLVAESTGKEGRGILPVLEPLGAPRSYGNDRIFVRVSYAQTRDRDAQAKLKALEKAGHPVLRLELKDPADLAAQFYLWETATAAAGFILRVNPFDQPDVQRAKDRTTELLSTLAKGVLPAQTPSFSAGGLAAFADPELGAALGASPATFVPLKDALAAHFARLRPGDYGVLLAYVNPHEKNAALLDAVRDRLRRATTAPVTVAFGPRYLHSTGQYFKGGNPRGVFLLLSEPEAADRPIPGQPFGFKALHQAQARGDFAAMIAAGRRVLRLDPGSAVAEPLKALLNAVAQEVHA